MTSHLTSKEKLVYTITFKNKLRLMWSLPIYPSVHPCIYPCMHSSVHLSIHPSNHLSILSVPTSFSSSFSSFRPCFPSTYPSSWASQVLPMVKNLLANTGDKRDAGLIPGSPGGALQAAGDHPRAASREKGSRWGRGPGTKGAGARRRWAGPPASGAGQRLGWRRHM